MCRFYFISKSAKKLRLLSGTQLPARIRYAPDPRTVSSLEVKYFLYYTQNRHFLAGGSHEKTEKFHTFMIFRQKKRDITAISALFVSFQANPVK